MRTNHVVMIIVGMVVFLVVAGSNGWFLSKDERLMRDLSGWLNTQNKPRDETVKSDLRFPLTPEKQVQRKLWIDKAIDNGIFIKTEMPGTVARVHVDKGFYRLTIDEKARFVGVAFAYYYNYDQNISHISLRDGYTGKTIGSYSELGLRLK